MTTAFTGAPNVDYQATDEQPTVIVRYAIEGSEQRSAQQAINRRRYSWHMTRTGAERRNIDTFFRSRNQSVEAFYISDPDDQLRSGVSLGTAIAGQTVFTITTSGHEGRFYPVDNANVVVKEDGSATSANVTVSTDNRTFTLDAAPGTGTVMTANFDGYRLVRLDGPFRWRGLGPNWFECSPEFREVPA